MPEREPDEIEKLGKSIDKIANAITPLGLCGDLDETGTYVESLTESITGVTAGLVKIADAIEKLAEAVEVAGDSYVQD